MHLLETFGMKSVLPWLIGGLMLGVALAVVLILGGFLTSNSHQVMADVTPILTVVQAPSNTPTPMPSSTPEAIDPTATSVDSPEGTDEISKGQFVEIYGTGGDNLRLRVNPGLDATIAFLGVESEVFEVLEGPQEVDGYAWWYLGNPYNKEKTGWAVSDYLRPITSP